ncbi:DDE-type integrase/transposase/recombinase [Pseudoalteromonas sp. MMG005]|uniref:DDE-type integrase/transposase/recombinase n=1 Tax=Pseudoalteromonas sp. MMG005 TaxID=2822682 RepID=UPI001FFD38E6|nr:DDE-type integrase/transposase/recombinase [Pseudoalteromonas sp. MMG005]
MTPLRKGGSRVYLAIAIGLCSRRTISWHINKRMMTDVINKAMMKAYSLSQPPRGLVFHPGKGSRYTRKRYQSLLAGFDSQASMGGLVRVGT